LGNDNVAMSMRGIDAKFALRACVDTKNMINFLIIDKWQVYSVRAKFVIINEQKQSMI